MALSWDRFFMTFNQYLPESNLAQTVVGLAVLLVLAVVVEWLTAIWIRSAVKRIFHLSSKRYMHDLLEKNRVYRYIRIAIALFTVYLGIGLVPHAEVFQEVVGRFSHALAWLFTTLATKNIFNALLEGSHYSPKSNAKSIKSQIQVYKLLCYFIGFIIVLSVLAQQPPLLLISGLGALSAVVLLVFRDTILSLVASTQLASNDVVRIGDWIQMPQCNADGFVRDIALHVVKVENWDNTWTNIPTYRLFSDSFRNHRQMFESGGRRIMRPIFIDAQSIEIVRDETVERLSKRRWFAELFKQDRIKIPHVPDNDADTQYVTDIAREDLTNLSVLRAYIFHYISTHPEIRKDLLKAVYLREPLPNGAIPIELYCFCRQTFLAQFSRVESEIFEHLYSLIPLLGLRMYQQPSGYNVQSMALPA